MKGLEHIKIGEILPQQPPFVFVDTIHECDTVSAEVSFTVREGGTLVRDGRLLPGGLVEHMAQACAAMSGYIAVYIRHIPFSIGYLGQVRGLDVKRFPRTGETLRTSVRTIEEIFGILMAEVRVFSDGELLASAIIKTAAATEQG